MRAMIVGVGTDVLEVLRMERELGRSEGGFVADVFTPAERSYCRAQRHPERCFAARFAAKEATFKALGAGLAQGLRFHDVEIDAADGRAPCVTLHGRAKRLAARRRVRRVLASLAATERLAAACVVLES